MLSRRVFLGALTYPTAAVMAAPVVRSVSLAESLAALDDLGRHAGPPDEVAADEGFWLEVQQAYTVDRSIVNLNNGGVCPSPAVVQEAMKRHLDYSNEAPPYTMWKVLEPQREAVRQQLARFFGCDEEEVALTRNASESLQICQLGFDLEAGDEILTTTQDYGRMVNTFRQRERREGVALRQVEIPVPAEDASEVVARFEAGVTARTRLILMCHVINLTGQVLPVREVVRMARGHGVPVIVDGAHAFAHFPFRHEDLDCDYYGTSLHKWLCAPHGTGLLYVRRDRIGDLWPLMAAPEEMRSDIRKFEEIGTHPAAGYLAIAEALAFHLGIGGERKAARLRYLTRYWAEPLLEQDRVTLHTSLKPGLSCGIGTVQVEGVDSGELTAHLWDRHRILTTSIKHEQFEGVRVTPNVYTLPAELDRFVDAVLDVVKNGLPSV